MDSVTCELLQGKCDVCTTTTEVWRVNYGKESVTGELEKEERGG
jgi:hypothetical protein